MIQFITTPFDLGLFGSTFVPLIWKVRFIQPESKLLARGITERSRSVAVAAANGGKECSSEDPATDAFLAMTTLISMGQFIISSHSLVSFAFGKDQLYEKKLLECNWCEYSGVVEVHGWK